MMWIIIDAIFYSLVLVGVTVCVTLIAENVKEELHNMRLDTAIVDNFNRQCLKQQKSLYPCMSTYPGKPKMIKK